VLDLVLGLVLSWERIRLIWADQVGRERTEACKRDLIWSLGGRKSSIRHLLKVNVGSYGVVGGC